MASTDYPLSVSSKFVDDHGTEHLVTVRGRNLEDFSGRLAEAGHIFPYAGFAQHQTAPTPEQQPEPTPTNPVAATADQLTASAQQRQVKGRIAKNGDAPVCPQHQRNMLPSKYDGGFYCPTKNGDDYCQHKVAA